MKRGRLEWYHPDRIDGDRKALYDEIVGAFAGRERPTPLVDDEGRLEGPFNAMLASPAIGAALQHVGNALRFPGVLPRDVFEVIVLIVGVERRADYEWYAHFPLAERAGVAAETIAALRCGEYEGAVDVMVLELVLATLEHREPEADAVTAATEAYGVDGVTEIVVATAYYDLIAALLRTWATPLPNGAATVFSAHD